ncbi:hypothetical protein [Variovorax boronicumulans]
MSWILAGIFVSFLASWKVGLAFIAVLALALWLVPVKKEWKSPDAEEIFNLAVEATAALEQGLELLNNHPYSCGPGIAWFDGVFVYDDVQDGVIDPPEEGNDRSSARSGERREFTDREKFTFWFSKLLAANVGQPEQHALSYEGVKKSVGYFRKQRKK